MIGVDLKTIREMSDYSPHPKIVEVIRNAYGPCPFFGECPEAKWLPEKGHVPRGFLGGTGKPEDVEVVLVLAEPGHPEEGESYDAKGIVPLIDQVTCNSNNNQENGNTLYHRNLNWFLGELWPHTSRKEKLKKVWITESRLCSVEVEIADALGGDKRLCAREYLVPQIELFPNATVILFGGKAQKRADKFFSEAVNAISLAPPGCNQKKAKPSWGNAIKIVEEKRSNRKDDPSRDDTSSGPNPRSPKPDQPETVSPNDPPHVTPAITKITMEARLEEAAEALTQVVVQKALGGDMAAMQICFDRLYPPNKADDITILLENIRKATGASEYDDHITALEARVAALEEQQ
jgi:hypothetical protein